MPVELVGQQIRIAVRPKSVFVKASYRTLDVGQHGKLQFIRAIHRKTGEWITQSIRINLSNYYSVAAVYSELDSLKNKQMINSREYMFAAELAEKWFDKDT